MQTNREKFDARTYVRLLLDFVDHDRTIAIDSKGKSHANEATRTIWMGVSNGLLDQTGRAQMGLADTAGNISAAHISGVSRTGGGHTRLSSQTKRQSPLRGGQQ